MTTNNELIFSSTMSQASNNKEIPKTKRAVQKFREISKISICFSQDWKIFHSRTNYSIYYLVTKLQ